MSEDRNLPEPGDAGAGSQAAGGGAGDAPKRSRRRRLWLLAGAAATAASLAACAQPGRGPQAEGGWGWHGWGHRHGWHRGPMDAEAMARRIDKGVDWVLSDVGASAEQKSRVADIARQAAADLAPLRDRHRAARRKAVELLAAPAIDRDAIERLRADELRAADEASKRLTRALADIAEALTPEQRVQLKARIERRMGRRWS